MKRAHLPLCLALVLPCVVPFRAQAQSAAPQVPQATPAEPAIRTAIDAQVAAWNRGDIPAFMRSYEDSPETTFIGLAVRKGYQPILQRYKQSYTNQAQMGKLTFSDIEIRLLPGSCGQTEYAIVTGKFHLDRTTRGEAKKDDGIFSLVWHKGTRGWKIILDHTS